MTEITTIIPYYNGSNYIKEALDSLEDETLKSKEIIIINDGSTDEEGVIYLKNLIAHSPLNISFYQQENSGQGSARNHGAQKATTKYITFLDQDDLIFPKKNEILIRAFKKMSKKISYLGYVTADAVHVNAEKKTVRNKVLSILRRDRPKMDIIDYIDHDIFQLPGSTLFDKEAFLNVGGFDERLAGYEDDDLFVRLYRNGFNSYIIDEEVIQWRINSESTSYSPRFSESRLIYAKKLLIDFRYDPFLKRNYPKFIWERFNPSFKADIIRNLFVYQKKRDHHSFKYLKDSVKRYNKFYLAYRYNLTVEHEEESSSRIKIARNLPIKLKLCISVIRLAIKHPKLAVLIFKQMAAY